MTLICDSCGTSNFAVSGKVFDVAFICEECGAAMCASCAGRSNADEVQVLCCFRCRSQRIRDGLHGPSGSAERLCGVLVQQGANLQCSVRLDNGEEVQARISKHIARSMLRVIPGDRVRVAVLVSGEFRVLGHE